jgi:hypothetical protein
VQQGWYDAVRSRKHAKVTFLEDDPTMAVLGDLDPKDSAPFVFGGLLVLLFICAAFYEHEEYRRAEGY